ncbi:cytochrome b-c1 complex subunit 10-like [Scyliorhinus canicula]|uniref:cytochrome b-c1 complex subunit 10-like n=1 Tax=Scyliorhinus canicula TaxID=7830 RepID=UPI0018F6CE99|nr:cytochrome b-c1 complex subunit 10-like [Scyliorhinus canicula]
MDCRALDENIYGRWEDSQKSLKIPTMATWGGVGCVALVYATDWKVIVDRIPYIRGKFKTE